MINANTYYYEHYSLLIICYLMYDLYFYIQPIHIFMVCQSGETTDNKEDSEAPTITQEFSRFSLQGLLWSNPNLDH